MELASYEGMAAISHGHDRPEGDRVHWKEANSAVKMNGVKVTSRKLRETWVLSTMRESGHPKQTDG